MGETPGAPTGSTKRQSSAQQAQGYPAMVCNTGFHLIDREFWLEAARQTCQSSAPGMDQGTAPPSAEHLAEHLRARPERWRANRDVAPPVERVWIEKEEGTQRPIGTPGCEAKLVQRAVVMS
jgi:RNA-directed DNA polymerase